MTDTEKLKLLRDFIRKNITCIKPHEAQGLTAAAEYDLITTARKLLRQTQPKRKEKTK